ncbi:MAG: site-specific integrase [Ruminococcus flavefaciens]|nr:site-specific integrase [Ruminococcus flavefaciens]MCM1062240.1 site-specific integrase [Eubacterium sp.]
MANITPRKNKNGEIISYRIRVSRGYDSSGKKLKPYEMTWKPSQSMTPKQIEKELNRQAVTFEENCRSGKISSNQNIKLSDFCKIYLEIKKDVLAPRTFEYYSNLIDSLIITLLGHIKLSELKPAHIQQFVQYLQNDISKPSAATVKRKLAVLQSILKQAVKLDIISLNPANSEKLTLPKTIAPKIEIFTKQEAAEMLRCLEQESLQFQVIVQLAIMTGARLGEIVALKFSDVDYRTNKITIERSAYKLAGQPTATKAPKDNDIRTVTVNSYCVELIKLLRAEKQREALRLGSLWNNEGWMFTQWNGDIMYPQTPSKQFCKFLEKNGLNHRKFHALRHTSATLLLYGGVNIKQVQERLGHGDLKTTNLYLHCVAEADEKAANVLQEMLITKKEVKIESLANQNIQAI